MSKKSIFSAFVLSAALFSTSAFAQGMYIAGDLGNAVPSSIKSDLDSQLAALGNANINSSMTNGTAMSGALGYQFNQNFAVEAGYFNSGTLTYSGTATGKTLKFESKLTGMRLGVLGTAPLTDKFSLVGKLGYSFNTVESKGTSNTTSITISETMNGLDYGVSAMYKLVDNISVKIGYESVANKVNALLVGVQIKF